MRFLFSLFFTVLLFFSCSNSNDAVKTPTTSSKPNILLLIADDMGLDATPSYTIGSVKPNMPNLQNMISTGVRFTNFWSYPTCTPTRASILTGKYGFRTNVKKVDDELSTSEIGLQKYLDSKNAGYSHAVIGKWHLSKTESHPTQMGIDYYAGLLTGTAKSYTDWNLTENGVTQSSTVYATTKFTDLAINWIDNQTNPWFLWLAYNAPHAPFHLPPSNLHSQGNLPSDEASINANPQPYYMAMLEAMDSEIGRLLNSMTQEERNNTIIIFIGDNGTPGKVAQEYHRARTKGSLYKGGINVPMIVSGKNVSRVNEIEDALTNTTDIFATITDIATTGTTEINDSKSFKSLLTATNSNFRDYIYSEIEDANGDSYTIRNKTHKYIKFSNGNEALNNLSNNPLENPNLLNANQLPLSAADEKILNELKNQITILKQ